MSSKSFPGVSEEFFVELKMVSEYSKYPKEILLKVSSISNIRFWRFLIELELVEEGLVYP